MLEPRKASSAFGHMTKLLCKKEGERIQVHLDSRLSAIAHAVSPLRLKVGPVTPLDRAVGLH
jgi:hypothetical protein